MLAGSLAFGVAAIAGSGCATGQVVKPPRGTLLPTGNRAFWPNGARLAVSISMQFEGGGQPISGAPGPITEPIAPGVPDLTQNTYYEYGPNEGIPRMLDLFDRHAIKVTSFMIGEAVDKRPDLAKEIVRRGHEAANHGKQWAFQYLLSPQDERAWILSAQKSIEAATGTTPVGYDCYWMRGSVRTLELLQELGYLYHNNDLSRDEPYVQRINGKPFAAVPYTAHLNDIASFNFGGYDPEAYVRAVCDEFDQLYAEAGIRRRMLSISLHDRISGRPYRIAALERIFAHMKSKPGVWFARRDEIARHALATPAVTLQVERSPAPISGLPGSSGGAGSPREAVAVHMVLLKFAATATPQAIDQLMTRVQALPKEIPGILEVTLGRNFSTRGQGYSHAITMRFRSRAALEAFYTHAAHQRLVQEAMKPIVLELLPIDYEDAASRP